MGSPTLDFGSFRWDTPQTKTFCITNGSQFTVTIQSIAVTPSVGTMTNEFTIGQMKLGATCGTGSVVSGQPSMAPTQNLEVTVTAKPHAQHTLTITVG